MILNKHLSLILTVLFFILLLLLSASIATQFLPGITSTVATVICIVIFWRLSKSFYNYLRNDDFYKNNKSINSDKKGEKYLIKGDADGKKIFIIVWVIVILILLVVSMWLYSYNHGFV